MTRHTQADPDNSDRALRINVGGMTASGRLPFVRRVRLKADLITVRLKPDTTI